MTNTPEPHDALPLEAVAALWRGRVIDAIKLVRQERNLGLKEAKDWVDAYVRSQPALKTKMEQVQTETRQALLRWVTLLAAGTAALTYFLMQGR